MACVWELLLRGLLSRTVFEHLFVLERISLTFNVISRLVLKGKDEEALQVLAALSDLPMSVTLFAPFTYD
jgi:hypothetical protein